jgi:hypothetical protein
VRVSDREAEELIAVLVAELQRRPARPGVVALARRLLDLAERRGFPASMAAQLAAAIRSGETP